MDVTTPALSANSLAGVVTNSQAAIQSSSTSFVEIIMASIATPAPVSRTAFWIGTILSVLPAIMLIFSAAMKFTKPPDVIKGFEHLGWSPDFALKLGILELCCVVVYLIPRTSVLGAILLTGYLGGATATHVRIGEGFVPTVAFGVLIWLGLYLRDRRIRALIPLRN